MAVFSPISEERLDRELMRRPGGFYRFLCKAWPHVEEAPLVPSWHLEEIGAHLEAVSRGELDRLVINIPPGCSKSLSVSVLWQAWDWGPYGAGHRRYMFGSFDADLSRRDSMRAKGLIQSDWYQRRWGFKADPRELEGEGLSPIAIAKGKEDKQDTATVYWSTAGGFRFSTSTGGKATGWHCHHQIIDDPTKPAEIQAGGNQAIAALNRDWEWYSGTMSTRKADPKHFARVIIMQRLHELDLAGRAAAEGYTVLKLPMEFRSRTRCVTPWGGDRRTQEGELLVPGRFDAQAVATTRKDLGPLNAAAQLDQEPAPESGSVFLADWFKTVPIDSMGRFAHRGQTLNVRQLQLIQSWDFTFKNATDSDFVVGSTWAYGNGVFLLLDIVREKAGFLGALGMVRDARAKWPAVRKILIEDKANGTAIMEVLKLEIPGIIGFSPKDSKEARANATSGYYEAGDVLIAEGLPHFTDLVREHTQFPRGAHDDMVDSCTQGLLYMTGKLRPGQNLKRTMGKIFKTPGLGG